jgi:deoxyribonuclease V
MRLTRRHRWDVSPQEAVAIQQELRREIVSDRPLDLDAIRLVAGVDVSVKDNVSHAAIIVVRWPGLDMVETALARRPTPFPYVPGLLSFREGPVLEDAFGKLESEPDVFVFDGMGIAHPRRMGIAAHMGLWLERPTIGCGKTRLCGRHAPVPPEKGAHVPLIDKGETIGAVLRTRANVNPVFISPGHLADIPTATDLVLRLTTRYRLPEPIRMAHNAAGDFEPASEGEEPPSGIPFHD